jgi:hypothetical protein
MIPGHGQAFQRRSCRLITRTASWSLLGMCQHVWLVVLSLQRRPQHQWVSCGCRETGNVFAVDLRKQGMRSLSGGQMRRSRGWNGHSLPHCKPGRSPRPWLLPAGTRTAVGSSGLPAQCRGVHGAAATTMCWSLRRCCRRGDGLYRRFVGTLLVLAPPHGCFGGLRTHGCWVLSAGFVFTAACVGGGGGSEGESSRGVVSFRVGDERTCQRTSYNGPTETFLARLDGMGRASVLPYPLSLDFF